MIRRKIDKSKAPAFESLFSYDYNGENELTEPVLRLVLDFCKYMYVKKVNAV